MTYTLHVYQRTLDITSSVIAVKISFAFQVNPWPRIPRMQICPGLWHGVTSNESLSSLCGESFKLELVQGAVSTAD